MISVIHILNENTSDWDERRCVDSFTYLGALQVFDTKLIYVFLIVKLFRKLSDDRFQNESNILAKFCVVKNE